MSFFTKMKDMIVNNIAEIYEITYNKKTYYYTNLDYDFEFDGVIYKAKSIKRSNIKRDENVFSGEMNFSLPKNDDISIIFRDNELFVPIFIKVYGVSRGDISNDKSLLYTGYINSSKTDESLSDFSCNTNELFTDKQILRYRYGYGCQNDLYDKKCGLNPDDFKTIGTITDIKNKSTSITITLNGVFDENYFKNGYVMKDGIFSSTITEYSGNEFKLFQPFYDLKINDIIEVYAGCERTSGNCINKFNNFDNFFGFEHIPNRNPMNGREL